MSHTEAIISFSKLMSILNDESSLAMDIGVQLSLRSLSLNTQSCTTTKAKKKKKFSFEELASGNTDLSRERKNEYNYTIDNL